MECMEGKELFDRVVEQQRFSEADAVEAVNQMLLSINYLHVNGCIHRDIKLENFLYTKIGSRGCTRHGVAGACSVCNVQSHEVLDNHYYD
eukprot:2778494-Amphidinium_carterae.2